MARCPNCQAAVESSASACPHCRVPVLGHPGDDEPTLIGAGPGGRVGPDPSTPPTHLSQPAPPRSSRALIPVSAALLVLAVVSGVFTAFQLRGSDPTQSDLTQSDPSQQGPLTPGTRSADPPEPELDPAWGAVAARAEGSVRRIVATTCSGTGVGTAFVIGPDTVATAWHSVSGATDAALVDASGLVPAAVIKVDPGANLALLRTERPLVAPELAIGTRPLEVGDEALIVGRAAQGADPMRGRSAARAGRVLEVGSTVTLPEGEVQATRLAGQGDPGLAGAPVLGRDGALLGMVVEDPAGGGSVALAGLSALIDPLAGPTGQPPAPGVCAAPAGPKLPIPVGGTAPDPARAVAAGFIAALNAGQFDQAYARLDGQARQAYPIDRLAADWRGSSVIMATAEPAGADLVLTLTGLGGGCRRQIIAVAGERITRWQPTEPPTC